MNSQSVFVSIASFVLGAVCVWAWVVYEQTEPRVIARHWKIVDAYNELIRDEDNYSTDPNTGLRAVEITIDPEPSLAALVAMRELRYVDLVLPTVKSSREANLLWMDFTRENYPGIVFALGNPSSGGIKIAGEQPLHLQIWYREGSEKAVVELVGILERLEEPELGE